MRWPINAPHAGLVWTGFLVLALVAAIFLGATIWQRARHDLIGEPEGESATEVAETLRAAYDAGELTEEEYRKVCKSLGDADGSGFMPKVPRF